MAFLQKAIDVVMLVSGEPLAAKPVRIVCGHEPERTNELLQAVAKCCLHKVSPFFRSSATRFSGNLYRPIAERLS